MPFRESAEHEVLLRQEQEHEADATALEQQVREIANSDAERQLLALAHERDRLQQEIEKLCDDKIAILKAREGDPNDVRWMIYMMIAVFFVFVFRSVFGLF